MHALQGSAGQLRAAGRTHGACASGALSFSAATACNGSIGLATREHSEDGVRVHAEGAIYRADAFRYKRAMRR